MKNYQIQYVWKDYKKPMNLKLDVDKTSVTSELNTVVPLNNLYYKMATQLNINGKQNPIEVGYMYSLNNDFLQFLNSFENEYFKQVNMIENSIKTFESLEKNIKLFVGVREVGYKNIVLDIVFGEMKGNKLDLFTVVDYVSIQQANVRNNPKHDKLREVINDSPELLGMEYLNDINSIHMVTFPLNNRTSHILKYTNTKLSNVSSNELDINYAYIKDGETNVVALLHKKLYKLYKLDTLYTYTIDELNEYLLFSLSPLFVKLIEDGVNSISIEFTLDDVIVRNADSNELIEIESGNTLFLLTTLLNI